MIDFWLFGGLVLISDGRTDIGYSRVALATESKPVA